MGKGEYKLITCIYTGAQIFESHEKGIGLGFITQFFFKGFYDLNLLNPNLCLYEEKIM